MTGFQQNFAFSPAPRAYYNLMNLVWKIVYRKQVLLKLLFTRGIRDKNVNEYNVWLQAYNCKNI